MGKPEIVVAAFNANLYLSEGNYWDEHQYDKGVALFHAT
jgi:hypothetical protein